jgi:hypothetical protein
MMVVWWCHLSVREKVKLRVFETKRPKRTFEHKKQGVTGGWREMHEEDLHELYCSLLV